MDPARADAKRGAVVTGRPARDARRATAAARMPAATVALVATGILLFSFSLRTAVASLSPIAWRIEEDFPLPRG